MRLHGGDVAGSRDWLDDSVLMGRTLQRNAGSRAAGYQLISQSAPAIDAMKGLARADDGNAAWLFGGQVFQGELT